MIYDIYGDIVYEKEVEGEDGIKKKDAELDVLASQQRSSLHLDNSATVSENHLDEDEWTASHHQKNAKLRSGQKRTKLSKHLNRSQPASRKRTHIIGK